jgi:hypothetical protein
MRERRAESAGWIVNVRKRERSRSELISKASHTLSNEKGWVVPGLLTHCAASAKFRRLWALPAPRQLCKTLSASTSTASIRRCSPDSPRLPIVAKFCDGRMTSSV